MSRERRSTAGVITISPRPSRFINLRSSGLSAVVPMTFSRNMFLLSHPAARRSTSWAPEVSAAPSRRGAQPVDHPWFPPVSLRSHSASEIRIKKVQFDQHSSLTWPIGGGVSDFGSSK